MYIMTEYLNALNYRVERLAQAQVQLARELIIKEHYSGTVGRSYSRVYGLFCETQLVGASWWLPPSMPDAKSIALKYGLNWKRLLGLSRLVVASGQPQNAASYLIGRSIRLLKQEQFFECLVTYADTWRGHSGAIYKATNWTYLGETKPSPVWWNDKLQKTRANRNGSVPVTEDEMARDGFRLLGRYSKHKFVFLLSS